MESSFSFTTWKKTVKRDRHKSFIRVKFVESPSTLVVSSEGNAFANPRRSIETCERALVSQTRSAWRTPFCQS